MSILFGLAALANACEAPTEAEDVQTQYLAYAERSVRIAELAIAGDEQTLGRMIDADAEFAAGGGDVLVPLGSGISAAIVFVDRLRLNASQFSYPGWDYMSYPADACGPIEIEIRFTDAEEQMYTDVTFKFDGGMLSSANGWTRSLNSGLIRGQRP